MKGFSYHPYLPMLLSAVLLSSPLLAQENDAEARATAIVNSLLSNLRMSVGELDLQLDDDYELTQDDGTFSAIFEAISIGEDAVSVSMGPVAILVTPGDDGLAEVALDIPDTLLIREDDTEVAKITITERHAEGVWSDALNGFRENELELLGLTLDVPEDPVSASIANLSFGSSMNSDEDESWSSESHFGLQGIAFGGPEGQSLNIAAIRAEGELSGSDFAQFMALAESLQELLSPEQLEATNDDPSAMLSALGELYNFLTAFEASLTVSDVSVGQGDMSLGALTALSLGSEFSRGESGSAFSYSIAFEGLETPVAPLPPDILPNAMRLEIGLENIPSGLIEKLIEVAAASEELSPAEQQAIMGGEVLGMVMSSELGAYVSDTFIAAPQSRVDLDLSAQVSEASPFSAIGELNLQIVGLDTAVQMAGLDQDPDIAPMLAMLTAFSNRSEENDQVIDRFALEVTSEGKLMLNGKDMTAMLMGGGAPPDAGADTQENTEQ